MKVGLIRGAYLSQFEMQIYEQMKPEVELEAYKIMINRFDTGLVSVPIRKLHCIDDPATVISPKLGFYFDLFLQATCGLDYYHLGLVKALADRDIAHTMETFNAFSWQALQAKRRYGTKLVVTVWENRPFAAERFGAKRRMKYEVLEGADLFLAMTPRVKDCLELEGADPAKIRVLPPGVNVERFKPRPRPEDLASEYGIREDDFVILSVATLRWEKGVFQILYAFKKLVKDTGSERLKLVFAGSGPAEKELQKRIDRLGLRGRAVITRFPYDRMHEAYNLADVFVLGSIPRPGWLEQFGYVLAEALASGLPVITTESGSIPEVVGECADLVPPADYLRMAHALRRLLEDEDRRRDLGRAGRERAEGRYDCRRVAAEIRNAYEELLA
ncbi:glycosyltransferase family 4 protein [Kiritimatiella glycovorans]|uniref:Glycosyltransferase EpsD n=1 Tax=Kiritimatiella glycovorans TaxID=1307763 RepID=A0A0G3EIE2_9BACT|nr:glycosyltransferase family 4 protein [Kiritimatiella glycovorans]AKJ63904.1 Putative glycosyltransferase EpsD [Kiritimatiella glycovorans]